MTTITIECDLHGKLTLIPTGLHITIRNPGRATIEFFSTCCKRYQVQEISGAKIRELRALGVTTLLLDVPPEAFEQHRGTPLSFAELNSWLVELYSARELEVPAHQRPLLRRP